ncbi:g1500 [Coccomyxa viridis]|uniref:G1500 protein n=1 Tax=Coccomyxa viridis TaxID=1274662 RepID=A0ABP1FQ00_9CHLO
MEASEEGKLSMLRKAFHSGLARALEPINQQEFHKCFPSFDARHAMAFYDLYRQVLFQVRGNSEAEFEIICEEAQLVSKFAALNQLAAAQGLTKVSDTGADDSIQKPADIILARRVAAKLQEAEELLGILEQEEQRLASSRQAKEQAEQQLQERAKAATDITCGVDQVHVASKAWNARTVVKI